MTGLVALAPWLLAVGVAAAPNPEGRWARKTVNVAVTDVPVLGELKAETVAYTLVDLKRQGTAYQLTEQVCFLETISVGGMVKNAYPKAFVKAVSGRQKQVVIDGDIWLETETQPRLHGAKNVGADEALPERGSKLLVDADHDGHPGLTVRISGFVEGEVYVVERSSSSMKGSFVAKNHVVGTVDWSAEQNVLGASRDMLDVEPQARSAKSGSLFEMKRAPANATCNQLMARKDRLFPAKKEG